MKKKTNKRVVKIISEKTSVFEVEDGKEDQLVRREETIYNRHIEFADILSAIQVEEDDAFDDPPWEGCGDYDHELVLFDAYTTPNWHQAYDHYSVHEDNRGVAYRVELTRFDLDKTAQVYRDRGCSKSVARQKAEKEKRDLIEQIIEWRTEGWSNYWVHFEDDDRTHVAGMSTCIVDTLSDQKYLEEVKMEVAMEVVHHYQKLGFIVDNLPPKKDELTMRRERFENRRRSLKWRMEAYT